MMRIARHCLVFVFLAAVAAAPALARDVAFVEPGSNINTGTPDEAFKIEPKPEVDIGESVVNIVRRESLFFVNQTSAPIKIEKVAVSSDSAVTSTITNDDCSKTATIPAQSRCSIELSVTPTGPGSWGIELLMTHNGPGRITRAKILGKTGGSDKIEKRENGLFLSPKEMKPVEFGEVTAGDGKIVRSALMVNDSPASITLYSVDVVEADKSLQKLDSGCTPDLELKPGESCPVTLVWTPTSRGIISTDLIIRHSGQTGFVVIPVRGTAKPGDKDVSGRDGGDNPGGGRNVAGSSSSSSSAAASSSIEPPPTPSEVAREVAKATGGGRGHKHDAESSAATGSFHLIGTVGNRAVLLKPDGSTAVVQVGDSINLGADAPPAKIDTITSSSAVIVVDGKKKELALEAVQELKDKATAGKKGATDSAVAGGKDNAAGGAR